jgi:hypothetical protein
MNEFAGQTDRKLSELSEDMARKLSRRQALLKGVKGAAAAVAVLAVGGTVGVRDALAATSSCGCSYPGCGHCSCRGKSCPSSGCPSGCYICKSTTCPNTACIYTSGSWIDSNCPCGRCGFGYFRCYDCRCTSCSKLCGCRSICLCSGCCSPEELEHQFERDKALVAA